MNRWIDVPCCFFDDRTISTEVRGKTFLIHLSDDFFDDFITYYLTVDQASELIQQLNDFVEESKNVE